MEKFDENHPWNAFVNAHAKEMNKYRKLKINDELNVEFADGKKIRIKRVS